MLPSTRALPELCQRRPPAPRLPRLPPQVRPTADVLQLRCCLRELAILQHFGQHEHPNLLGLRTVMRPPEGQIAIWQDLYLVTELLDSDLHQAHYIYITLTCTRRTAGRGGEGTGSRVSQGTAPPCMALPCACRRKRAA